MAKPTNASRISRPPSTSGKGLPIKRDSAFARIVADEAIVINRAGGNVHLSLLVLGPDPVFRDEAVASGTIASHQVRMEPSLTEVARVQLPGADAFSMAMQIIELTLAAGRIKIAPFRVAITKLLDEHEHLDTETKGSAASAS